MAALAENPDVLPNAVLARATPDPQVLAHAIHARESVYRVFSVKDIGDGKARVFSGSGFAIRMHGKKCLILTCEHVLRADDGALIDPRKGDTLIVRKMSSTGGISDFPARVCYNNQLADLAVIEATGITEGEPLMLDESAIVLGTTAVAVGYCDVPDYGWTRMPTVSTGVTTHVRMSRGLGRWSRAWRDGWRGRRHRYQAPHSDTGYLHLESTWRDEAVATSARQ
ncbi:hypothetical protein SORBI_3002G344201 [Sorghum bicolor]|uniref:Serine protease n=1 Tax=Sorghum bicolor TaxID=4558 RepID=A0A1W0W705_SORBI|nr:hypothetical protein SORBI_3002G344201 [Sorghum bicolor]